MPIVKKEFKGWASYYPENVSLNHKIYLYESEDEAKDGSSLSEPIPFTLTLEIPVEEKKIELTKSQIEEAFKNASNLPLGSSYSRYANNFVNEFYKLLGFDE